MNDHVCLVQEFVISVLSYKFCREISGYFYVFVINQTAFTANTDAAFPIITTLAEPLRESQKREKSKSDSATKIKAN